MRELVPSADFADVKIEPDSGEAMGMDGFLLETGTDGMAIVHRGRLVFERYANGMSDETPHILMSISKSMLGLLIREIGLEDTRRVVDIVSELKDTAYRGAILRDLLDMRAAYLR